LNVRPADFPVTLGLIGISLLVYLLMIWKPDTVMRGLMISQYYRPSLPEIRGGELWRLLTPAFLHFGIFHVVFNLMWTWELGRLIENRQGSALLLLLFIVSDVAANLAQYLVDGPVFGGMSGVVYALFGYVWIQGLTNPRFGVRLNPPVVYLLLGWFVICWTGILEKLFGLGVANTAHTAGLLTGVLLSFGFTRLQRVRRRR
jgi:GlpG protein